MIQAVHWMEASMDGTGLLGGSASSDCCEVEAGTTRAAAAQQFSVSVSCAVKLVQRFRRIGSTTPAP
jgi:hypothetical protein